MLLPQGIERLQSAAALDVPEGPAVARRRTLERGADLVDRAGMAATRNRAVGAHRGSPATLGVGEVRPWRDHSAFHQEAEGDARLLPLVGDCLHRAFVEG